jgi:hypothetical protein
MKIELHEISVRDLVNGYKDSQEEGIVGYGGKLNIRPKYQREFVYKDKQRDAVIDTLRKFFPLNIMYWVKNEDGTFEVLDGQQRTISICEYVGGNFSINEIYFHTLQKDAQEQILNYKLMIYFCEGGDTEKLEWFKTINIAGVQLSDQELRNAVYTGEWLTNAKKFFSKNGCPAISMSEKYVKCEINRQELLELALKWISKGSIEKYMADHQQDPNANELWIYFNSVITWVNTIFPTYRKEMKGLAWGELYNEYGKQPLDTKKIEEEVEQLMKDVEVTNKKGIYTYVMDRKEKNLNLRTFDDAMKREAYENQKGICLICKKHFEIEEMEGDHKMSWHMGGKTDSNNCQMLCRNCNREKSGK